jgi:hypothetical protein
VNGVPSTATVKVAAVVLVDAIALLFSLGCSFLLIGAVDDARLS